MKIIAFGHRRQTGKNLSAYLVHQNLRIEDPRTVIKIKGFADPLYDICHKLYGWDGFKSKSYYDKNPGAKEEKLPTIGKSPRTILIEMGTLAIRSIVYEPTFVDFMLKSDHECDILLISDLRFPNEFEAVKKVGGICIKLIRPGIPFSDDEADTALTDCDAWDYEIINDGTKRHLNDEVMKVWNIIKQNS